MVIEALVQRKEGEFYGGRSVGKESLMAKDVIILLNPGLSLLTGGEGQALKDRVDAGAGLLFIGGLQTFRDWVPRTPIAEMLPVLIDRPETRFIVQELPLRLSRESWNHPVVRLRAEEVEGGIDPWIQLPPLPGHFPITRKKQGARVLLEGLSETRPPVVVTGSYGRGKVITVLSAGFWRLDLLSSGVEGRPQTIRNFWQNAVKWLSLQVPAGRVRVSTERHIYRAGEQVVFTGQVFDELLRPQSAAAVQIALDGENLEFQLQDQGGGHYRGTWAGLGPGEYHYTARASAGDLVIGVDEGRFIVDQHSIESVDVRADKLLLGEMARVSGGRYRALEEWREMLELLGLQKRLVEKASEYSLWGQKWPVVLVILLLAGEWFVRKRCGMI